MLDDRTLKPKQRSRQTTRDLKYELFNNISIVTPKGNWNESEGGICTRDELKFTFRLEEIKMKLDKLEYINQEIFLVFLRIDILSKSSAYLLSLLEAMEGRLPPANKLDCQECIVFSDFWCFVLPCEAI